MGVRQVRRDSRARSTHRGYWCNGTVQREETGASAEGRGEQAAGRTKQKGGEDRQKRGEGGGARRGYTPEHVYGQKCGSPRLAIGLGNG